MEQKQRTCTCQPATSWASQVMNVAFWAYGAPIFEHEYELREKIATEHGHLIPFLS